MKISALRLITSLIRFAKNEVELLLSRQQRATLELAQMRNRLLKLALIFALVIGTASLAIVYSTVLIVYLNWDHLGWKILVILALAFAAIAAGLLFYAYALCRQGVHPQPSSQLTAKPAVSAEASPGNEPAILFTGLAVAALIALAKHRRNV